MNEKKEKSESVCEWCDGGNLVWTAPNELWNEVVGDSFSFLCPNCFMKLAECKKIYKPVWTVSDEPLGTLLAHSQQQLLESLSEDIEKIDVSGGGSGRRLKEQFKALIQSKKEEL